MERKKPAGGEFYRHFQGGLCQVKMLVRDSETREELAVYQQMYPPFQCWAQKLEEFMGAVDGEKYPDCPQAYRFERVDEAELQGDRIVPSGEGQPGGGGKIVNAQKHAVREPVPGQEEGTTRAESAAMKKESSLTGEQMAERGFLELLDASTFREKREIFVRLKNYWTPLYISNIAAALDVVLQPGDQEEQFLSVLHCLEAFERYEGGRLR